MSVCVCVRIMYLLRNLVTIGRQDHKEELHSKIRADHNQNHEVQKMNHANSILNLITQISPPFQCHDLKNGNNSVDTVVKVNGECCQSEKTLTMLSK